MREKRMENLLAYIEQSREEAERVGSSVKDFRVFDFSFIPDKPLVRPETKRIIDCLVRYQKSRVPRNLIIVGPRGCRKPISGTADAKMRDLSLVLKYCSSSTAICSSFTAI